MGAPSTDPPADSSPDPTSRAALGAWTVLVVLFVGLGLAWLSANLGDVPRYGDTLEYLWYANKGEVDEYRGFLYPELLRRLDAILPGPTILRLTVRPDTTAYTDGGEVFRPEIVYLQLVQLAVGLLSLAYFVSVMTRPRSANEAQAGSRSKRLLGLALLTALLCVDPLVAHFNLSVMTDGLALSGSAAFCAALASLLYLKKSPWLPAAILFVAAAATAGLRVEKGVILMGTLGATLVLGWLLSRFETLRGLRPPLRRSLLALGLLVLALLGSGSAQRAASVQHDRWPSRIRILHQRVIFPHLASVLPDLPAETRAEISLEAARRYDADPRNAHDVIDPATGKDPQALSELTSLLAGAAWSRHATAIVLDIAKDTVENVFSSLSFYFRLSFLTLRGEEAFAQSFHSDGTAWTFENLQLFHPRLSRVYLGAAGGLLLLGALGCLAAATRRRGGQGGAQPWVWFPALVFALVNGAAFACGADLVHVRYAVLAHVLWLTLLFRQLLGGLLFGSTAKLERG